MWDPRLNNITDTNMAPADMICIAVDIVSHISIRLDMPVRHNYLHNLETHRLRARSYMTVYTRSPKRKNLYLCTQIENVVSL